MNGKNSVLDVQLALDGKFKAIFLDIKKANGLEDDSEVFKLIVREYFEKVILKGR